ncbi:nuclear receptor 2C2-associated protein [Ceratobasidium sp. AG-Ba]|nr:nuclear receptor 2C2-associated protein [Ceratobasidium sp. AG-Ba]
MSLIDSSTIIRVSSTLDKSVGKKHLVDGSPETCWTSTAGLPQSIELQFYEAVNPTQLALTFQGGFVGTKCTIYGMPAQGEDVEAQSTVSWHTVTQIFPEDINRRQLFSLKTGTGVEQLARLKLVFEESSDFFGRITLYNLELF